MKFSVDDNQRLLSELRERNSRKSLALVVGCDVIEEPGSEETVADRMRNATQRLATTVQELGFDEVLSGPVSLHLGEALLQEAHFAVVALPKDLLLIVKSWKVVKNLVHPTHNVNVRELRLTKPTDDVLQPAAPYGRVMKFVPSGLVPGETRA